MNYATFKLFPVAKVGLFLVSVALDPDFLVAPIKALGNCPLAAIGVLDEVLLDVLRQAFNRECDPVVVLSPTVEGILWPIFLMMQLNSCLAVGSESPSDKAQSLDPIWMLMNSFRRLARRTLYLSGLFSAIRVGSVCQRLNSSLAV